MESPAAARNRQPILDVLRGAIPEHARILEIASGTGEHAIHCAAAIPGWEWQPSDTRNEALASIEAWRAHCGTPNIRPAVYLDATGDWPSGHRDALIAINLIHIAPWTVTRALMAGAARYLRPGGILALYGPFQEGGEHTGAGNRAFDADLRSRDPRWGIRDLDAVTAEAAAQGLYRADVVTMPADNRTVLFRSAPA